MEQIRSSSPALLDAISFVSMHRKASMGVARVDDEKTTVSSKHQDRALCSPLPNMDYHRPSRSNEWGQLETLSSTTSGRTSRQHQSVSPNGKRHGTIFQALSTTTRNQAAEDLQSRAPTRSAIECQNDSNPGQAQGVSGSQGRPRQRLGKSSAATTSCYSPTRLGRSVSYNSHDSPPLGIRKKLHGGGLKSPRASMLIRRPSDVTNGPLSPQPEHLELLASEDGSVNHSGEDTALQQSGDELRCIDASLDDDKVPIRPRRSFGHFGWRRDLFLPPSSSRSDSEVPGSRKGDGGRTRLKSSTSIKRFAGMARRVSDAILSIVQPGASSSSHSQHDASFAEIRSEDLGNTFPRRGRVEPSVFRYQRPETPEPVQTSKKSTPPKDDSVLWGPSVGGFPRLDQGQKQQQEQQQQPKRQGRPPRRLNTAPAVLDIDPFRPAPQRFVWKGSSPGDSQESHLFSPQHTATPSGPSLQTSNESPPTTLCTLTDDVQSGSESNSNGACDASKAAAVTDDELSTIEACEKVDSGNSKPQEVTSAQLGDAKRIRKRPSTTAMLTTDRPVTSSDRSPTTLRARRRMYMLPPASPAPQVPPPPPPRFSGNRDEALAELARLRQRPSTMKAEVSPRHVSRSPELRQKHRPSRPPLEQVEDIRETISQPMALSTRAPIAINQRVSLERLRSMQPIKVRVARQGPHPALISPGSCM